MVGGDFDRKCCHFPASGGEEARGQIFLASSRSSLRRCARAAKPPDSSGSSCGSFNASGTYSWTSHSHFEKVTWRGFFSGGTADEEYASVAVVDDSAVKAPESGRGSAGFLGSRAASDISGFRGESNMHGSGSRQEMPLF